MRFILLFILTAILISPIANAEIYKSVDENGVVTYSDQPNATSESVNLPAENIAIQPKQNNQNKPDAKNTTETNTTNTDADQKKPYTTFVITSPQDQDSIQNAVEITVTAKIIPALQEKDKVQFFMDGNPVDRPSSATSISIPKVQNNVALLTRGTHTLLAKIIDDNGEVVATTPQITIFLHYYTVNSFNKVRHKMG